MKKIVIILNVFAMMLLSSCINEDLLEKADTGDLTLTNVYADIRQADNVLNGLYNRVRNIRQADGNLYGELHAGTYLDAASIYGQGNQTWSVSETLVSGAWNASNCPFTATTDRGIYSRDYVSIRAIYLFLENIEKVPFDPEFGYGAIQQQQKIGEAQFLLAWHYHEMMRFFGGITLVKSSLTSSSDEILAPRNTYDECVDYVTHLCDSASEKLPLSWPSNQLGRVTKGAAFALKARVLLYAASPLFNNPNKPENSPFRGKYDVKKWEKAAAAAAEVIKLGQYSLYPDISRLFVMNTNPEVIFQRMGPMHKGMENFDLPGTVGQNPKGGLGHNMATYNLLQLYKILKNGVVYNQNDPASGFNLQDPYKNLDPRFYRDIVYNGAKCLRVPTGAQMWAKGEDGTEGPANGQTYNTFLFLSKFCDPLIDATKSANTWHQMIYIRYAEVLLNYAEAMNEAFGPEIDGLGIGMTARNAVNIIRKRTTFPAIINYMGYKGGMPDFPINLSRDDFRKEIRQERKVELAYEGHMFFDFRRWREPVESQQTVKWLIPSRKINKTFSYSLYSLIRPFTTANYLFPLNDSQILLNPKLIQNPGWPGSPEAEN